MLWRSMGDSSLEDMTSKEGKGLPCWALVAVEDGVSGRLYG